MIPSLPGTKHLGLNAAGEQVLRVRVRDSFDQETQGRILVEKVVNISEGASIKLRGDVKEATLSFEYSLDGNTFETLIEKLDSSPLTTAKSGGFTGAIVGMYSQGGEPIVELQHNLKN